jgi:hypothetical protein
VWFHGDPADWAKTEERRWDTERASAAQRRLVGRPVRPVRHSSLARWALNIIEHVSLFSHRPAAGRNAQDEPATLTDAEIARLLALLAPSIDLVPLKPGAHEEDPCTSC